MRILCLVLSVPCVNAGWTNLWADETKSDESVLKVEGEEHHHHHRRRQQQQQEHQQHAQHEKYDALGHHSHEGHHAYDSATTAEQQRKEQQVEQSGDAPQQTPIEYGVDVSFPIHHNFVSSNYPWLPHNVDPSLPTPKEYQNMPLQPLGDRQTFYKDFLNGCVQHYGKRGQACVETEHDRIEMSLRQPQSMQNYTEIGYKKIKCPPELFNLISDFWKVNHQKAKPEVWGVGNTYTNNWASPTSMVSVEDSTLRGGGYQLKQRIWDAARTVITAWTGEELTQCSLYGIRVYKEGAVLATHVDRLPLVSSAIINVAQDVDEPWPLEVIGHDGKAFNVTMEPGDMVLYESHSVLHGRPFPLKGRFYANVFIHFEPTGHSLRHNAQQADAVARADVHKKYREAIERGVGGHENDHKGLPSYIVPGTPEERHWRMTHPEGFHKEKSQSSFATGSTSAHIAAQIGNVDLLEQWLKQDPQSANARDANGWTPMHEAARGGHVETIKLLVKHGADVNAKTFGDGGTALYLAKQAHGAEHPVIDFLESIGALEAGPEL